jgi:hypothetical protein
MEHTNFYRVGSLMTGYIILSVVLYGGENRFLTIREEETLRVFVNRVLKISGQGEVK